MFEAVTKSGDALIVHNTLPPVGTVMWLSGNTVPDGCLVADGAAVSRTTYAELFAVIGTTWGKGNGSTTFGLPDMRNRFPEGAQTAGGYNAPGLPKIKGTISFRTIADPSGNLIFGGSDTYPPTGSFYRTTQSWSGSHAALSTSMYSPYAIEQLNMDASRSSSVYGNSDTVQPASVKLLPVIVYRSKRTVADN